MEFDKSKVYTALNADELKIGSKVIVGDTVDALRNRVQNGTTPLTLSEIRRDSYERRFRVEEYTEPESVFSFAYLVSEPEETWIVYVCRSKNVEPYLTACRSDRWEIVQKDYGAKTKLFEGTDDESDKWYEARRDLTDVIAAWEDGKQIQWLRVNEWEDVKDNKPLWDPANVYRVKPEGLKWTDLMIGDIIQDKNHTESMMVIGIDYRKESKCHIYTAAIMLDDDDLNYWEKVEYL